MEACRRSGLGQRRAGWPCRPGTGDRSPCDVDGAGVGAERDGRDRHAGRLGRVGGARTRCVPCCWSRRSSARSGPAAASRSLAVLVRLKVVDRVQAGEDAPRRSRSTAPAAGCRWRRLIASRSSGRRHHARWPARPNLTSPRLIRSGSRSANSSAAAARPRCRSGSTSVACIDSDTSIASITVARSRGTRTPAVGLATPSDSTVSATSSSAKVRCRRQPGRRGATLASSSTLLNRATYACAAQLQQRRSRRASGGDGEQDQQPRRRPEMHQLHPDHAGARGAAPDGRPARRATTNRTMSDSQSRSVRSCRWAAPAWRSIERDLGALLGGGLRRSAARSSASEVCTSSCSPVSGSTKVTRPAARQLELARVQHLDAEQLVPVADSAAQRPFPVLVAEEVRDHHHQAAPARRAAQLLQRRWPGHRGGRRSARGVAASLRDQVAGVRRRRPRAGIR